MESSVAETLGGLDDRALVDELVDFARVCNRTQARLIAIVQEVLKRRLWEVDGLPTAAMWLSHRVDLSPPSAREHVRVAKALLGLPTMAAQFAAGELSYSQVRAVTRVATPEREAFLLRLAAQCTADELEHAVRRYRQADEDEQRRIEAGAWEHRKLWWLHDGHGAVHFNASLPEAEAEQVIAAIEGVRERASQAGRLEQQRADALLALAKGSVPGAVDRHTVMLHVSAEALGAVPPPGAWLEHGGAASMETARQLTCSGAVVPILEDARGEPLAIGRRSRVVPPALLRALRARDPVCCWPGCQHRLHLHAHHIVHWADGGATDLDNLVLLCGTHHRDVHREGGSTLTGRRGALEFRTRRGELLSPTGPRGGTAEPSPPSGWRRGPGWRRPTSPPGRARAAPP